MGKGTASPRRPRWSRRRRLFVAGLGIVLAAAVAVPLVLAVLGTDTQAAAGTPRNDVVRGTSGPDVLRGGAGNDRLLGLAGADRLQGGRVDRAQLPGGELGRSGHCGDVSAAAP